MPQDNSLEFAEQIAARICHDLVGPVGAIANGVELLAGGGDRADPEVIALIAGSARSASLRLQYFRVAFGSANGLSSARPMSDARALAESLMSGGKVALAWPPVAVEVDSSADRALVKAVLALLLVAGDSMPRGGTLRVSCALAGPTLAVAIDAEGQQARLLDEVRAALAGEKPVEAATPRALPATYARLVVGGAGGTIAARQNDSRFVLECRAPRRTA